MRPLAQPPVHHDLRLDKWKKVDGCIPVLMNMMWKEDKLKAGVWWRDVIVCAFWFWDYKYQGKSKLWPYLIVFFFCIIFHLIELCPFLLYFTQFELFYRLCNVLAGISHYILSYVILHVPLGLAWGFSFFFFQRGCCFSSCCTSWISYFSNTWSNTLPPTLLLALEDRPVFFGLIAC